MAIIAAGLLVRSGESQVLNLGGAPKPRLDTATYAADLASTLRQESAADASAVPGETLAEELSRLARSRYRLFAARVLEAADSAGPDGSVLFIAGLTLARGRESIDGMLRTVASQPSTASGPLLALRRFVDTVDAAEPLPSADDPAAIDLYITTHMAPLAEVVANFEGGPFGSHWPGRDGSSDAVEPDRVDFAALRERLAATPVPDDVRSAMASIIGYLVDGVAFAELRAPIAACAASLVTTLDVYSASEAEWMSDADRSTLSARLEEAIEMLSRPEQRSESLRRLDARRRTLAALREIDALSRARERRIPVDPLSAAVVAIDGQFDDAATEAAAADRMDLIIAMTRVMVQYRELPPLEMPGEQRAAAMKLARQYDAAEAALLHDLDVLPAIESPMADPAYSAAFNRHRQYLAALQGVRAMPEWVKAIGAIDAAAAEPFDLTLRSLAVKVLDPVAGDAALRTLDAFAMQLDAFEQLPLEAAIRAGGGGVTTALSDVDRAALVERIDQARLVWAQTWAAGGDGADRAAEDLALLARTTQLLKDLSPSRPPRTIVDLMNRWAAWELEPGPAGRIQDPKARLEAVLDAAVAGNADDLRTRLAEAESALGFERLLGRFNSAIGSELASLDEGATGVLGQVIHAPGRDAYLASRREQLADLCRYRIEGAFAASDHRPSLAGACDAYVETCIETLLRSMSSE